MSKVLLLDYDLTCYPPSVTALKELDNRINAFIRARLGLNDHQADTLRRRFSTRYGTTLRGLQLEKNIDPDQYYDFIHQVPVQCLPPEDPEFTLWLQNLNMPVYLFTNSRRDWAETGLASMGLMGEKARPPGFSGDWVSESETAHGIQRHPSGIFGIREIFDIRFFGWEGKPNPGAYVTMENWLKENHEGNLEIYFADDKIVNLIPAVKMGWKTFWVRPEGTVRPPEFDSIEFSGEVISPLSISFGK